MVTFEQDNTGALALLSGIVEVLEDWTIPLSNFHAYMIREVDAQFDAAGDGATGGTARGVFWRPFADQYTREDGTVVPAWGGVPNIGQYSWIAERMRANQKARGEKVTRTNSRKLVKGRKRPSGARITPSSRLMQDTGGMRNTVLTGFVERSPDGIRFGPGKAYATHQNRMRQFLFFQLPHDQDALDREAARWLRAEVEAKQRSIH